VTSFVAAIEAAPRRKWPWAAGGAGVAAIAVASVMIVRGRGASGPSCDDLASDYKPPATRDELARLINDPKQLDQAMKAIDRFTADYRKGLRESCRATQGGAQSAAIGDKRTACLEMAKRRAWFVTSGLVGRIDPRPALATLLDELPDVTACSDPEWLQRAAPLPVAQADRDALFSAEKDLLEAGRVRDEGKLPEATKLIDMVTTTAKRLGDRSLEARASLLASEIAHDKGDMDQAATDAMVAWSAASAHGDTDLTLRAQLAMLGAEASHNKKAMEGFSGLGNDVPQSANGARLVISYGDALMAAGKFTEGEAAYRQAQAIREKVLPPEHIERSLGMMRIGAALAIQKRSAEALPILEAANAVVSKAFPPLRREAIDGLRYLAMTQDDLGHHEKALELYREIYKRRVQIHGEASGMALDARAEMARVLGDLGYDEESTAELAAVAKGFVTLMGDKSVNAADARVSLANKLISLGRFDEADAELARATPIFVAANGPDSPYTMVAEYAQARSYVERPKPVKLAEAAKLLDHVEPTFAKLFGATSYPVAAVHYSRARIILAKGDTAGAEALAGRAIAMLGDDKRSDRAEIELFRARLQLRLGKRDEAKASADASATDYAAAGAGFATKAAASRAWAAKPT
jgi:tetratricopeptide (TPR) repeat protein